MSIPFTFFFVACLIVAYTKNTLTKANQYGDEDDDNYVISSFKSVEHLYLELKRLERAPEDPLAENYETRKKVCSAAVNSPFIFEQYYAFTTGGNHSNIFYGNVSSDVPSEIGENQYELSDVVLIISKKIEIKFREHLFWCSAWSARSEKVVNFFISNAYRSNNQEYRFMFEKEFGLPKDRIPFAVAIIERPARWCQKLSIPILNTYLKEWRSNISVTPKKNDELGRRLCNLSAASKIRLCALVLGARPSEDRHEIRFPLPGAVGREPRCTRRILPKSIDFLPPQAVIECEATTTLDRSKFLQITEKYMLFEGRDGSIIASDPTNTNFYEFESLL